MLTKPIVWDESLMIGHEVIDSQHKHLFEACEQLRVAAQGGNKDVAAGKCLGEMVRHIEEHFASEEEYMKGINYADLEKQIAKHRDFSVKVNDYVACFSFGYAPYADMLEFLV